MATLSETFLKCANLVYSGKCQSIGSAVYKAVRHFNSEPNSTYRPHHEVLRFVQIHIGSDAFIGFTYLGLSTCSFLGKEDKAHMVLLCFMLATIADDQTSVHSDQPSV